MCILRLEIKKIISSAAVLGFVVLCLAFNLLTIYEGGTTMQETSAPINVFEGYQTAYIAEGYIDSVQPNDKIAENMREKYAALQPIVEKKAQNGDSLGQYTYEQHRNLFQNVMRSLLMEGIIITILVVLLSLGNENFNRTEQIIYSSKVGRRIVWRKFAAAVVVALGAYGGLTTITLAMNFNNYCRILNNNISSCCNVIKDIIIGERPFTTWHSFTVQQYLWAVIGVSVGIIMCFSLVAFVIGTTIRNSYIGFLTIFLCTVFFISFPLVLPNNAYIKFVFVYTPIWLSVKLPLWFTDGGVDVLWRNFETWGTCISFIVLSIIAVLAVNRMKRRDIA